MPTGTIPQQENLFPGVNLPDLFEDSSGDVHILPVGHKRMLGSGLNIQEPVKAFGLSGVGDLYFGELVGRQPDFLESRLGGQDHLVAGQDDDPGIVPGRLDHLFGFGPPFSDLGFISFLKHSSGFMESKLHPLEQQVIRSPGFVFDRKFVPDKIGQYRSAPEGTVVIKVQGLTF